LTQGISPFEDNAGVAVWQMSRVPITGALFPRRVRAKDGGARTVSDKAIRTMMALNLIGINIMFDSWKVNVKL
jgi:hypothetical protein